MLLLLAIIDYLFCLNEIVSSTSSSINIILVLRVG